MKLNLLNTPGGGVANKNGLPLRGSPRMLTDVQVLFNVHFGQTFFVLGRFVTGRFL